MSLQKIEAKLLFCLTLLPDCGSRCHRFEHQRRLERFAAAGVGLRKRRLSFHEGAEPPRIRRYAAEAMSRR
jgi:hypothetical protein